MKTALNEMLDSINKEINKGNPDQYTLNRLWHRCTELIEKEKRQIQNSFMDGHTNSMMNEEACKGSQHAAKLVKTPEDYYNSTFTNK